MDRRTLFAGSLATIAGLRLSCFPSLPCNCLGRVTPRPPEWPGGRRKVLQRVLGSGVQPPCRSRGRGAGGRAEGFPSFPSAVPAAAGAEGGPRGTRRGTLCRRPPSTPLLSYPADQGGGGTGPLRVLVTLAGGQLGISTPATFSPPAAGKQELRCTNAFNTARHQGRCGSRVSSSTVALVCFCLPLPDSLNAPLPFILSVGCSVSDSVFPGLAPLILRLSLFLFHSLFSCLSWDVSVCLLFNRFSLSPVLLYFLRFCLSLRISSPFLICPTRPPEHQLPNTEEAP